MNSTDSTPDIAISVSMLERRLEECSEQVANQVSYLWLPPHHPTVVNADDIRINQEAMVPGRPPVFRVTIEGLEVTDDGRIRVKKPEPTSYTLNLNVTMSLSTTVDAEGANHDTIIEDVAQAAVQSLEGILSYVDGDVEAYVDGATVGAFSVDNLDVDHDYYEE